jgi:hypothetical protein
MVLKGQTFKAGEVVLALEDRGILWKTSDKVTRPFIVYMEDLTANIRHRPPLMDQVRHSTKPWQENSWGPIRPGPFIHKNEETVRVINDDFDIWRHEIDRGELVTVEIQQDQWSEIQLVTIINQGVSYLVNIPDIKETQKRKFIRAELTHIIKKKFSVSYGNVLVPMSNQGLLDVESHSVDHLYQICNHVDLKDCLRKYHVDKEGKPLDKEEIIRKIFDGQVRWDQSLETSSYEEVWGNRIKGDQKGSAATKGALTHVIAIDAIKNKADRELDVNVFEGSFKLDSDFAVRFGNEPWTAEEQKARTVRDISKLDPTPEFVHLPLPKGVAARLEK